MAVVHTPSSPRIPVGSLDYDGREKLLIRGSPERHLPRRRPTRSSVDSDIFSEPLAVIREARELEELLGLSDSALFPAQGLSLRPPISKPRSQQIMLTLSVLLSPSRHQYRKTSPSR